MLALSSYFVSSNSAYGFPFVRTQASHIISLSLSFLTCKLGIIRVLPPWGGEGLIDVKTFKYLINQINFLASLDLARILGKS